MESNQVAFIEGFVKQCAARGWTADQTSRALALVQLDEQLRDPDFSAGFAKQAASLKEILGAAGRWATDTSKPTNQAIVGAGIGGLGGLLFGGKNRIRNALIGAGVGGLAGYGAGRALGAGDAVKAESENAAANEAANDRLAEMYPQALVGQRYRDAMKALNGDDLVASNEAANKILQNRYPATSVGARIP